MKDANEKMREIFGHELALLIGDVTRTDEIRLRRGSRVFVRQYGRNVPLDKVTESEEFDRIIDRMCKGSYYTCSEYIKEGYIPLGDGYRAGVCGRAVCDGNIIKGVYPIESITVRIPHLIRGIAGQPGKLAEKGKNLLIYAPPGEGKTTFLRDIALTLCEAPLYRRVSLIDSRCELALPEAEGATLMCVYSAYPKDKAAQYALRSMSPDYIISDEISCEDEAKALLSCQRAGVCVIATTHANSHRDVMSRPILRSLIEAGTFDFAVGIKRGDVYGKFDFEVTKVSCDA